MLVEVIVNLIKVMITDSCTNTFGVRKNGQVK